MVSDLLNRLALAGKYERARIVEDTEEESYSDHELTNDVIEYWVHRYDFKRREEHLNRHPQFIVNVQGRTGVTDHPNMLTANVANLFI